MTIADRKEQHNARQQSPQCQNALNGRSTIVAGVGRPDRSGFAALLAIATLLLATSNPDLILVDVDGETLSLIDAIRSGEGLASRVDPTRR